VDWQAGLCPVAEDVIPRIVSTNNMVWIDKAAKAAAALKEAIILTESGQVAPLAYSELDNKILDTVRKFGPLEPNELIQIFDDNKWQHLDEHGAFRLMEDLRDRTPYKLSHAGPRKFAYHDLSN
jgi:hypothetical protein